MAAPTNFTFTYKEVVELLIRKAGVTEGQWALQVQFGLNAINVGANDNELTPAALVGVTGIGIQKTDKPTNLTCDASKAAQGGKRSDGRKTKPRSKSST